VIAPAPSLLQPRVLVPFLVVTLIWGSTWLVITGQLGVVSPYWSVTYRFAIAALAMFAYAAMAGSPIGIGREGHWLALLFGIPQFCLNYVCVYLAEQYVTSGVVAVIFALLVVPNALLAWLLLKHRFSRNFVTGSVIATAGVALLLVQELRASPASTEDLLLGIGLAVLGLLSASVANIIQAMDRLRTRSLPSMMAWGMVYGALVNGFLALALSGPPTFDASFVYVGGLLYLSLVGSSLAFSLYFTILRAIGPGQSAYTSLLIPVVAMLLSTLFEGYRWSGLAAVAILMALTGLFIALRARRAAASRDSPLRPGGATRRAG
jgi:drug/metabolite transporter (DMT)-like permease